jgi:hypothetical protein
MVRNCGVIKMAQYSRAQCQDCANCHCAVSSFFGRYLDSRGEHAYSTESTVTEDSERKRVKQGQIVPAATKTHGAHVTLLISHCPY